MPIQNMLELRSFDIGSIALANSTRMFESCDVILIETIALYAS